MKQNKKMKSVREKIKKQDFEIDEDGRTVVNINVKDADSLLSDYNDHGKEIISAEMATFIDNVTKPISVKKEIHLKIACENYSKEKEFEYKGAITNYYINEFAHRDTKLKNNLMISIIMSVIAVLCFTILYFMSVWNAPEILYLLFDVVSWVFAWEAVDQFFLERYFLKFKQYKEMQIIFAKITFRKLKER